MSREDSELDKVLEDMTDAFIDELKDCCRKFALNMIRVAKEVEAQATIPYKPAIDPETGERVYIRVKQE